MYRSDIQLAERIAGLVSANGGRAFFVGGLVRDRIMGLPEGKDVDIEIYGLAPEALECLLGQCGEVYLKGASFGVFGIRGSDIDIAMPRKEHCTGRGHKDFAVFVDPFLPIEKAASRRDFTVNAMLMDVLTGEVIDCFGGREDIKRHVLRHVSGESFPEDPLRVFRGAQFAARFEFQIADETLSLMRSIDVSALSRERVFTEMEKALLKAAKPSIFFELLRACDQLSVFFPELEQTSGVAQNPKYHPEGDVWAHTMRVLDQAAALREEALHPLYFMISALLHDLGKITSSQVQPDGRITSYLHPEAGVPLAQEQLARLTSDARLTGYVLNMVLLHMRPTTLALSNARPSRTRMLFDTSVCPEDLILLAKADAFGCGENRSFASEAYLRERLADYREIMRQPMVTGKDLIREGYHPGEQFKEMLEHAKKLHFAGIEKAIVLKQLKGDYPLSGE